MRIGCLTPAFSGVPDQKEAKTELATPPPALTEALKRAELLCNPYILGSPQHQAQGENQNWLPHPCLVGGPKEGGIATYPLPSHGSPIKRGHNQNGLPHPCLVGGPKEGGIAT